jgi:hypothetical protein
MSDSYTFTGRVKVAWYYKINPIWWLGNTYEQNLSQADWFMTGKPQWLRWIGWQARNPLQNFRAVVLGVQDHNYTVVGRAPVLTVQRDDLEPPETGWQWCVIKMLIPRPFVSYSGSHFVFQLGWQPSGFFGLKINFK